MHRRPCERAELDLQHLGVAQRQAHAAHAQKRIALSAARQARDRLVAPGVERAYGDRPAGGPLGDAPVSPVLLLFARELLAGVEQELGAHQPDAVHVRGIDALQLLGARDIQQNAHPLAARHPSLCAEMLGVGACPLRVP